MLHSPSFAATSCWQPESLRFPIEQCGRVPWKQLDAALFLKTLEFRAFLCSNIHVSFLCMHVWFLTCSDYCSPGLSSDRSQKQKKHQESQFSGPSPNRTKKRINISEPTNMAAPAVAAAGAAAAHTPLASASLYVGDLDANVTEPQVCDEKYPLMSFAPGRVTVPLWEAEMLS